MYSLWWDSIPLWTNSLHRLQHTPSSLHSDMCCCNTKEKPKLKHYNIYSWNFLFSFSTAVLIHIGAMGTRIFHCEAIFPFPHLQFFTSKTTVITNRLTRKLACGLIGPWQTYLVFIFNILKPLITSLNWCSYEVGGNGKRAHCDAASSGFRRDGGGGGLGSQDSIPCPPKRAMWSNPPLNRPSEQSPPKIKWQIQVVWPACFMLTTNWLKIISFNQVKSLPPTSV